MVLPRQEWRFVNIMRIRPLMRALGGSTDWFYGTNVEDDREQVCWSRTFFFICRDVQHAPSRLLAACPRKAI